MVLEVSTTRACLQVINALREVAANIFFDFREQ